VEVETPQITILDIEEMKYSDGAIREYTKEEADDAQEAIDAEESERVKKACMPPAEKDPELVKFMEYVWGDGFVLSSVAYQLNVVCGNPQVVPSLNQWDIPKGIEKGLEIPMMVYRLMMVEDYLKGIWPVLKVLMGSNIGNAVWTANVAVTVALFDVAKLLPLIPLAENIE